MSILKTIGGCFGRFASIPQQCIKICAAQGYLASVYAKPIHSGYSLFSRCMSSPSILTMIRNGPRMKIRKPKIAALEGSPQKRGVVLKVIIKKPKKPNSANRKCVRVRLTNGREVYAYVPGEGHNLQEHSIVMVEGARCRDLPAVKLRCVRGKYDLAHVKKKTESL